MSTSSKAHSIPEALWGRHRPTIQRLYIQEGRKLEDSNGVIDFMGKHHNFHARYVGHCISIAQAYI
jgi:hypothetical protein